MGWTLLPVMTLLLSTSWVHASKSLTEDDLMADIPVAVSVTRLPQSTSETPMAITVIDRHMIESSGDRKSVV